MKCEPEEFNDSQDNMEDPLKLDLSRQPTRKILTKKIEEKEAKVVFTDKTITKQYEFWRKYNKYET